MLKNLFCFVLGIICCAKIEAQYWYQTQLPSVFQTENTAIKFIDIVNPNTIWVTAASEESNDNSPLSYAKTSNTGNTWESKSFSEDPVYWGIAHFDAINENHAWTLMFNKYGLGAKCYRTLNGGQDWEHHCPYGTQSFPNIIHFFDDQNGVTMGDPINNYFEIYTTNDQGQQWNAVTNANMPPKQNNEYGLTGSMSAYKDTIWFGTTESRILKSNDRGLSWTAIDLSNIIGPHQYITHLALENGHIGMVLFRTPNVSGNGIALTQDAGDNWMLINPTGVMVGNLCEVNHISSIPNCHRFFITSANNPCGSGSAYSDDYGQNWITIDTSAHYGTAWLNEDIGWSGGITHKDNNEIKGGIYYWVTNSTDIIADNLPTYVVKGFPNPIKDTYTWTLELTENSPIDWYISDLEGKILKQNSYTAHLGKWTENIQMSDLSSGVYLFHYQINKQSFTEKLIKY